MGQILHGSARMTEAVRRANNISREPDRPLQASRDQPEEVAKWE